jgi:hypothetical protein
LFDCNINKIKFILQLDEPQPGTSTSHTTEPIDWSTYTPAKLMSSKLNSKLCGSSKNMSRRRPAANSATESVALKFEKVGTLKEEIAQYQLAYVKAQLNEIEVAKKREAEIFELKKSVEVRHRNYRRAIECIVPF